MPGRGVGAQRRRRRGGLLPALAAVLCTAVAPLAWPQDDSRAVQARGISPRAYQRLEQAQIALAGEDYASAESALEQMQRLALNDYEQALANQTYGYLHAARDQVGRALEYFERSLALDALPRAVQQSLLYTQATLYASVSRHQHTVVTLNRWLENETQPAAEALILLANAYSELGEFDNARPRVEQAVAASDDPPQSWLQLLAAVCFELGDYAAATDALKEVIVRWPNEARHWRRLAAALRHQGDEMQAMATLHLAYRRGLLDRQGEIIDLARMMIFVDDPYRAARILEAEMQAGRVQRSQQNLELLLSAWMQAREFDSAVVVIDRLAPMTGDGDYYLRKAQLYAARTNWAEVIPAAEQAIARGGLDRPGMPWLLKGMAESELGRFGDALDSLSEARKFGDNTRRQAEGWIQFVNDRMQVEAAARS